LLVDFVGYWGLFAEIGVRPSKVHLW